MVEKRPDKEQRVFSEKNDIYIYITDALPVLRWAFVKCAELYEIGL